MGEFPYTTVPGKLGTLLEKIREVGVPQKVNRDWLNSLGFKSSNDRKMISVLKFVGLIDESCKPTPRWTEFRGANYKSVLGDAVREAYADLYSMYPDAHQRPQSDLEHFFSTTTKAGKPAVEKTVSTFRALVQLAEFSSSPIAQPSEVFQPGLTEQATGAQPTWIQQTPGPSLHIDIQIHISPDASPEQIDQIFASMARHLYSGRISQ